SCLLHHLSILRGCDRTIRERNTCKHVFILATWSLRIGANPQRFPIRLYQPPVESDIHSKPPADRAVRSRSTIRRVLDRNEDRIRERRRRVLAAAVAYNNYDARRG